ncbi:MAG TPA: nucleotidyltransferase family protein [bacterium]|jgi:molybdopterin-guanine dinucleotide biosynthesis protein A|nr:nucleotidyltransferase family protein [bacterium]
MDAIVLAGGGSEPGLDPTLPNKAFVLIAGRPLVVHVVAALAKTPSIGRIAVVGPEADLRPVLPETVTLIPAVGDIMDNVIRALEVLQPSGLTLVTASDLPLLTPFVIEEVLDACTAEYGDFFYPIVPDNVILAQFPAAQKMFITLAEGTFCAGNMMILNPAILPRVRPFVERIIGARKQPLLLRLLVAQALGWSVFTKLYTGKLSITEVAARASDAFGVRVVPVIVEHPEIAMDVDIGRSENLDMIQRVFGSPEGN